MSEPQPQPSLHQSAISLLRQARVPVRPRVSPLVQLMQWGLENNRAQQHRHLLPAQGQALKEMEVWSPQEVEHLLTEPEDPEVDAPLLAPDALEGLSPLQGAQRLLCQFHDQLPLCNQMYPPHSHLRNVYPQD